MPKLTPEIEQQIARMKAASTSPRSHPVTDDRKAIDAHRDFLASIVPEIFGRIDELEARIADLER